MIHDILSQAAMSNAIRTNSKTKGKQSPSEDILSLLEKQNPEQAKSLREKLAESNKILEQMKSSRMDLGERQKASARQKIAEIKAKLQMLQMMARINPEAAAKQIKKLSKELAAAVRQYASAGGSGIAPSSSASPAAPASTDGVTVSSDVATGVTPPTTDSSPAPNTVETTPLPAEEAQNALPTEETFENNFKSSIREQIEKLESTYSKNKEDSDFTDNVREIKFLLKSILSTIKHELTLRGKKDSKQEINTTERALQQVDRYLGQVITNSIAAVTNVNITV